MPRLRPVRTKEEAAQVPSDESLDIDLTEPEIELAPPAESGLQPQTSQPLPEPEPVEEAVPEARLDDVASLKERLAALEKADVAYKQQIAAAQQRVADLERDNRASVEAGARSQEDAEEARYVAILNALESAESESKVAVSDLEKAENDGDIKLKVDATKRLAKAERAVASHEDAKLSYEAARKDKKERPQSQQPTGDRIDVAYAHLPPLARDWLREHQDYTTDPRKIAKLGALHWEIVDEGHEQFSKGYLDALSAKLGYRTKFGIEPPGPPVEPNPPAEPRRAAVTSAPPTREAPSLVTGKPQSSRITLTPEQREAAKISNVDEITYARNVIRLQNEKKNGRYQERG